jgi:hypothetical protein
MATLRQWHSLPAREHREGGGTLPVDHCSCHSQIDGKTRINQAHCLAKREIEITLYNRADLYTLIAVPIVEVNIDVELLEATGNFVKVLVDQFGGFTKDVFHFLAPLLCHESACRRPLVSGRLFI